MAVVSGAGEVGSSIAGSVADSPHPHLTHTFPRPERIARARLSGVGIPATRAKAITGLARALVDGAVSFDGAPTLDAVIEQLTALRGFGPWTAPYIAMRAFNQPDAFPSGDLVLLRAAQTADQTLSNEKQLIGRAESWRPWRAYATMYLWRTYKA